MHLLLYFLNRLLCFCRVSGSECNDLVGSGVIGSFSTQIYGYLHVRFGVSFTENVFG